MMLCAVMVTATSCHTSKKHTASPVGTIRPVNNDPYPNKGGHEQWRAAVVKEAESWIGVKYRYAGNDRGGVDCSGLVVQVYLGAASVALPRNSGKQYEFCTPVPKRNMLPGDLIFFSTPSSPSVGHVGIFIGGDVMIHSSSKRGVEYRSITEPYYIKHYIGSGRIPK